MTDHRTGFVTLLGRPNVGKSTLVNRAVGRKVAIVTEKPQTTRSRILGICHRRTAQMILVDTPGIHKPRFVLNRRLVRLSFAEAATNDLNLVVLDAAAGIGNGDRFVIDYAVSTKKPLVLALNKVDKIKKSRLLPVIESCRTLAPWREIVPISALAGTNVEELERCCIALLPTGPPLFPPETTTDQPERLIVAELIREQVLKLSRQELPFATAVTVDVMGDAPLNPEVALVSAKLWVERKGQKAILIGKEGRTIKAIGQSARKAIEPLLGRPVFLDLRVRVRKKWRNDADFIGRLVPDPGGEIPF